MKATTMKNPIDWKPARAAALAAVLGALALAILPSQGGGGVTGTGKTASGSVADFGSVFVNGIEFFTDGAEILVDGTPQPEARLRVGMVVRVDGYTFTPEAATGQAQRLRYESALRGAADTAPSARAEGALVSVSGIAALITEDTILDGILGAGAIAAGDRLEVSGVRDGGTDMLRATYVLRRDVAPGTVLTGRVTRLTAESFMVGAATVLRDDTRLLDAPLGLAEGMRVRVAASDPGGGLALRPDSIRVLRGDLGLPAGTEASSEGIVSGLTSTSFMLDGLTVLYGGWTRWRDGVASDLRDGARLEAEGLVAVDGALLAEKIAFRGRQIASIDAMVAARTTDGFVLLAPDGVQVIVEAGTRLRDRSSTRLAALRLGDVRIGDRMSVAGQEIREGVVLAQDATRLDRSGTVSMSARARAASPGALSMLSLRVAGGATTYRDADGSPLDAAGFFAKAAGRRVLAIGAASGADVAAASLQISP